MKISKCAMSAARNAFTRAGLLAFMAFILALGLTWWPNIRPTRAAGTVAFVAETIKTVAQPDKQASVEVTIQTVGAAPGTGLARYKDEKPTLSGSQIKATLLPPNVLAGASDEPFFRGQLTLLISQTGRVGLQWPLPNGKPRDGKAMQYFETVATPNATGGTLKQTINWYGKQRVVTIALRNKAGNGGIIIVGGGVGIKPTPTPKPKPKFVSAQRMVGRKVLVSARMVITNSDDGGWPEKDEIVELTGWVSTSGLPVKGIWPEASPLFNWRDRKVTATKGRVFKASAGPIKVYYGNPRSAIARISGRIDDDDGFGSGKDKLLNVAQDINLLDALRDNREIHITKDPKQDDGKSENAELYIRVTDLGEFGLTPEQAEALKRGSR